ncbi:MAG: DUF1549 domain-containing protein [Planctomycetaceae bacterium]|nr:DUF1549 domain-containing protein [Planctomycetaceae bacterium]
MEITLQDSQYHQNGSDDISVGFSQAFGVIFRYSAISALLLLGLPQCLLAQQGIDFDKQIAPIFVSHCLECHCGAEPQGELDLSDAKISMQGGESGKSIIPTDAESSLLWELVSIDEMPPKHPLSKEEKSILKQWINEGAKWGTSPLDPFAITTNTRAGRDWWSLQPLRNALPVKMKDKLWLHNDIDAFVSQRLQQAGLHLSKPADPRTLIRRVYFDLIGLPPTPKQVAAFVADPSETAYQKIVDELLASKHYGERWARHWLDVVRFGESDGFERNHPRENAWPYRDWVINAMNADMPYDEFVRMQLIGDQLVGGIEGAAATGFWVAGVHNTTVGGSKRMKQLARQDEIEEVLATTGQAFIGLTVNCARCHDHKFDPITQKEYYQLASAISGLGYGERIEQSPPDQKILSDINNQMSQLELELTTIDAKARTEILTARQTEKTETPKPPVALARWEFDSDLKDSIGNLHGIAFGKAHVENGALILDGQSYVETPPVTVDITEKTLEAWIQLNNLDQRGGAAISIGSRTGGIFDAIVFGEREPKQWMTGSNGFVRTDSFGGSEETDAINRPVHVAIVYKKDGSIICYRDGIAYGHSVGKSPLQSYGTSQTEILFGLRHKPPGGNRYLSAKIHQAAIYNRALSPEEVAASAGNSARYVSEDQIVKSLDQKQQEIRAALKLQIGTSVIARDKQAAKANRNIFTLTAGTGATTNVLLRGDPDNVGEVVSPASIAAIEGLPADFNLTPDAPEADRRRLLAQWITHQNNPLFARVMVNRIWHYHFGVGIVDTPNDFGFNGGRPSHPELLEYLAWNFQNNGYRIKPLHRLIVTSSTYRQASYGMTKTERQLAETKDANNRLLWRGSLRRLEAESLRDAMLTVSGKLNTSYGGPSFKDVSVIMNKGTTYYEPIDVDSPEFWRRTVYRFNPRGGRSALLDTFDCPDSSTTSPRRSVTTTPLQSLSLMNNVLVLRMSDYFAQRVIAEAGEDVTSQIMHAWQLAIARVPNDQELQLSKQLVSQHGFSSLCRGLFNFNEFVMIE